MTDRGKLLALIAEARHRYANDYTDHTENEYIADMLLDKGAYFVADTNVGGKQIPEAHVGKIRKMVGRVSKVVLMNQVCLQGDCNICPHRPNRCKVGLLEDNADASAWLQGLYRYFGEQS
jgi:hypothetical protein